VQERRPEVAAAIAPIIEDMLTIKEALCHGDYTPKNILKYGDAFTLVDYETAHFGDPTMDLGLFLAHLTLKSVRDVEGAYDWVGPMQTFWKAYCNRVTFRPHAELESRGLKHLGVCLLARIDGTSPVDYLPDERSREWGARPGARNSVGLLDIVGPCLAFIVRLSCPKKSHVSKRVRSSTAAANQRWKSTSTPMAGPAAAPSCRPAPAPASTKHSNCATADPDDYAGKSVRKAVANVRNALGPAIVGMSATDQEAIDANLCEIDGTPDKSRLGANAILGVSLACAHAAAATRKLPLWKHLDRGHARMPLPMVNLISGGLHAGRNLDMQDFLLLPTGAKSYSEALHMSVRVYRALSAVLQEHGFEGVLVGDEGGFGPKLAGNEQAIEMILKAFVHAGLYPGRDAAIGIDVASTHFFEGGLYRLKDMLLSATTMSAMLTDWADRFPILSIEDGMAEDDWPGLEDADRSLGKRVQLIGDDLFVTNPQRLKQGIEQGVAKQRAHQAQPDRHADRDACRDRASPLGRAYRCVISARSGETEDSTIADLAVATGVGQIKIGSVARSERLAKYNQLLRIEEQMGGGAPICEVGGDLLITVS